MPADFWQADFDPVGQILDFQGSRLPKRRQRILHMRWHDLVSLTLDHAVALEPLQRLCKHTLADATDLASQVAEALRA